MKAAFILSGPPGSGLHTYAQTLADAVTAAGEDATTVPLGLLQGDAPDAVTAAAHAAQGHDVVHIQVNRKTWGGDAAASNVARFMATCQAPVVATMHDVYPAPAMRLVWRAWDRVRGRTVRRGDRHDRHLRRVLRRQAAHVLVLSEREKERLGGHASVIGHFIAPVSLPPQGDARRRLGITQRRVVTLLGFLHPRKGCDTLLEAIPSLPDDVRVRFVGGPPAGMQAYADRLQEAAAKVGADVTGFVPDDELPWHLAATDLAVCPFQDVSSSGSLATWIAAQRPVLAKRLPALEEWVSPSPDAVWFTDADDAHQWAAAISEALDRDDADEAQRRLQQAYSLQETARAHLAIYASVTRP